MAQSPKYQAICLVCYTCELNKKPTTKKDANITATGHMNAYGHEVVIRVVNPK